MSSYYEKILATGEVKCIDEEVPFEIPQGWEWERIGNLFETTSGSTPLSRNPDYYQNGSINWVRTTDLNNGVLCKTEIQITEKACSDYNLTILPQNSVCIAMYGGAGTIGKHSILQFDTTINQSVCAIKPNGYCNMDYLHIFIEYQRPYWMDFAAGSRKDPNINQLIIKHCLLPIPPQKEQTRIVEKLSLLHPYITQYGECQIKLDYINKEILDKFKKSILQEAIQGKLVPQLTEEGTAQDLLEQIKIEKQKLVKEGKLKKSALNDSVIFRDDDNRYCEKIGKSVQCIDEEIPFEIPESWVWCKFQDIANSELGKTMNKASDKGSEVPYLCSINVYWDKVDLSNVKVAPFSIAEKEKYLLQKGDLLICEGGEVGRCAIWSNDKTMYYQNALHRVRFYGNISSKFIQNVIRSYKTMGIIDKNSKGMTIKHFTKTALNSLYIPLPPFQEQQRIVAQIEKLFEQLH
ncbi:restriction endonuclease subunit S [Segatella copri]|uniref:restriction endonuclease subunit S n=1 Tax=Segatella copri TaxID=165179 RepID=UPI0022310586|nr:restriction endonuclease subunit S [Segatella copri]MCW4085859.1 restriction endonuclease subunit S [Segatella copri]MCW4157642.1 restriction endonuclease subunit S [Segatella copri]